MIKNKFLSKNNMIILLKITVTIVLLMLILSKIDLKMIRFSIDNVNLKYFIFAFLCSAFFLFSKAFKWRYLLKDQNEYISFSTALKSLFAGLSLGIITPGHAGEISRAFFVETKNRIKIAGLVIFDRLFDLLGVFILSISGAFFFSHLLGIIAIILCISLISLIMYFKKFNIFLGKAVKKIAYLRKLFDNIDDINGFNIYSIIYMSILSLIPFMNGIFQFYFLISAFEKISLKTAFLTVPMIALVNLIPITIAGIGIREGSAILLLSNFNVSSEASASAAFIQFLMNSALPAILGIVFIPRVRMFKKKVN